MDHQLVNSLGEKLQRLKTNDSSTSSVFSRNPSSSSVTTLYSPSNGVSNAKSLSFTKIKQDLPVPKTAIKDDFGEALELALSNVQPYQGQPKSSNKLNTTPTNEPVFDSKWCIILVGLPASGKSSICKNLIEQTTKYFTNTGDGNFKIDSFNAGSFRRKLSDYESQSSEFFDFNNQKAKDQRERFAHIALEHLLNSLVNSQIDVGVFDATNSTVERRENIINAIKDKEVKTGVKINTVILHVKCTDMSFWKYNVEGKTNGPDYKNKNHDDAIADFVRRTNLYQKAFQAISPEELSNNKGLIYLEVDNCGKYFSINQNGFEDTDDLIYKELIQFIKEYYEKYGIIYDQKVKKFWENKQKVKG